MEAVFSAERSAEPNMYVPDVEYGLEGCVVETCHTSKRETIPSDEALVASVNRNGQVDLLYMAEISHQSITKLITDLSDKAIFQNPAAFVEETTWNPEREWLLSSQYLCGNIPAKLRIAESMEEKFPGCFRGNIQSLRKLLPPCLELEEIHVSLGATWIPAEFYERFIRTLLRLPWRLEVIYQEELSRWMIKVKEFGYESVLNKSTYGTADISALRIIEQTMNARTIKIYDPVFVPGKLEPDRVLNREKTLAAQEKQQKIIREFEAWVLVDEDRRERLQECYNDAFVGYCSTPYDGSFLTLPDLNPAVHLYEHQKNAVARILLSNGNLLLAHDVGTGKTYEMVASAHELHRMGLSRKTMIVVPNSVIGATVATHKLLYPQDSILSVFPKDFTPQKRNAILGRIQSEKHVCIYMAYSSFDMLQMSKNYYIQKQLRELNALRTVAANASSEREKRALEAEAKRLNKKMSEYVVKGEETP